MKAIYILNQHGYVGKKKTAILHNDVTQIGTKGEREIMRCAKCGKIWEQTINSPQIVSDTDIENYKETKIRIMPCRK